MFLRSISALFLALTFVAPAFSQQASRYATTDLGPYAVAPNEYEILGITVEGVGSENIQSYVVSSSGLRIGQTVVVPGDPAFAEAIRNVYRLGLYSDVRIIQERQVGNGLFLAIHVIEEPRLAEYSFVGARKGHRDDLKKQVPLFAGSTVKPADLERTEQVIRNFYAEKGYPLATVEVEREERPSNTVALVFTVDKGPRVEIGDIIIHGNEEISDRAIQRKMKETKEDRWWRFWKKAKFEEDKFEEDLYNVLTYYNEKGYYDALLVSDSVYMRNLESNPEMIVELSLKEGPQYHIRDIEWEGNTIYTDEFLTESLGFQEGDTYNGTRLEQNLYANRQSSDVSSLYMNRGYMRFQARPTINVMDGDSLDLHFDIIEGDVYEFGDVNINGNTKTKEHVIRRELYTVPGQTFSRDLIQESIRRLSQLNYFTQESLAGGPGVDINEDKKTVDLTYNMEEQGSDQLELSGTWGSFGLILMLRFTFNNFSSQNLLNRSAWDPLPSGDGQQFSVAVQTNGSYYQSYSLSFTEPWFRGKPTPVGFSLSYSRFGGGSSSRRNYYSYYSYGRGGLQTGSVRFFVDRRLKWPDDKFNASSGIRFQYYKNDSLFVTIPQGVSQLVTFQQSITRNSLDHPIFPTTGSSAMLSVEVSPPIARFVQYHKWRFKSSWNIPLAPKLSIGFGNDFGYVGSLTGNPVDFERFIVGGSPFDTQGFYNYFGRDIIYMRGYPAGAIGPRREGEAVGGTILNKYVSELRWNMVQSQQVSAAPYLFMDAANAWNSFSSYNPVELYRSAGVGVKLFLPILGMIELTYGYNFDEFTPLNSRHDGTNQWYFQFTLGQGFGL